MSDSQTSRSIDSRYRYQFDSDNSVSVIRSQLVLAKDNEGKLVLFALLIRTLRIDGSVKCLFTSSFAIHPTNPRQLDILMRQRCRCNEQ